MVILPAIHNRFSERVFGQRFGGCRQLIELRIPNFRIYRVDSFHAGAPRGQRAGLIKRHLFHISETLERIALLHQHTVPRGVSDCCHDRGRSRKHEGAGAENDQHGYRTDDFA